MTRYLTTKKDQKGDDSSSSSKENQRDSATTISSNNWSNACQIWFSPDNEIISNELREMPRTKRELVWADLSGNSSNTIRYENDRQKETLENVSSALEDLEAEIKKTPTFTALKQTQQQYPEYVNNVDFRMQFLRCEQLHAKNAAVRMLRHYEEKKLLFADDPGKMGRNIQITDLDQDDLDFLESGAIQILQRTDQGGRRIYFLRPTHKKHKSNANYARALWYMVMDAVKDVDVQKWGVVRLVYTLESDCEEGAEIATRKKNNRMNGLELFRRVVRIYDALPFRTAATYIAIEPVIWNGLINGILKVAPPAMRVRTRLLTGSYQECLYHLLCLGMPSECVPVSSDGVMDLGPHLEWMNERREKEGSRKKQRCQEQQDSSGTDDVEMN